MSKYTELMLQYSDGELDMEQIHLVEKELSKDISLRREYVLNQDIDECMRGFSMFNEINSDSDLLTAETISKSDIADYFIDKEDTNPGLSFFINGALSEYKILEEQVDKAEREKHLYNVEQETNTWISDWVEQKDKLFKGDSSAQKLLDFVKQGMKTNNVADFEPVSNKPIKKLLYRIASIAAVLVISIGLWMLFSPKPSTDGLFAEYYQPYQIIDGQTRSNGENVDRLFRDAVKNYKSNNFEKSSMTFEKLLEIDHSSVKMRFLHSVTQIELKNYEKAISGFNYVIETNGDFVIEAKWYLSMCYLKTDKIKEAKALLVELSHTPGYYKSKSINLLSEL
jgi:tetratricopeptide (TPR) repeat protein